MCSDKEKETKLEALNSEDFFDLMQEYRFAPLRNQEIVVQKFENVKNWIKTNLI